MIRTLTVGTIFTVVLAAQSNAPVQPDRSTQGNVPYHGQTGVPNNAAANDQQNTALSGNTPQTNSSMQENRSGNLGIELGWLGVLGLLGLLGFARGSNTEDMRQNPAPEMHRG